MNWENFNLSLEPKNQPSSPKSEQNNDTISFQNEEKRLTQLKRFQDFCTDPCRKNYLSIMSKFGELIVQNKVEEIARTLLTEDCETFLFNFGEQCPVKYTLKSEGFANLYKGIKILKREVKETSISLGTKTGFMICHYSVLDENKGINMSQFSFEIFSFREDKIHKSRTSFGCMAALNELNDPFKPSRKDVMMRKVRELNNAWADKPDLERLASLLGENTEYKIWRWKDKKCFTFNKHNIVSEFKALEEDFVIKSIVPFEVTREAQYIVGSYVYHLEGKGKLSGQKFNWLSNCIFAFDIEGNISKINQQGELYGDDEMLIPFETHSKEKMKRAVDQVYEIRKAKSFSIFNTEEVNFSFEAKIFGPSYVSITGPVKGFHDNDKVLQILMDPDREIEDMRIIDLYLDLDDINYDSIILTESAKGTPIKQEHPYYGKMMNFYSVIKVSFENEKIAKFTAFFQEIPEPIPSPYDDVNFAVHNVRNKHEFV